MKIVFSLLFLMAVLGACTKKPPVNLADLTPDQLVQRGRQVYAMNCIACHNSDPKLDGPIGPAVWGVSREVLNYKILGGSIPEGYARKKAGAVMPKMPHLEKELPALDAYLKQ
jgi:mono/diheme cytochrome c family protein